MHFFFIALTVIAVASGTSVFSQDFPGRPIRMVVPFTAGSGSDLLARLVAPKLRDAWGQQVVIDNRAGAGGTIGAAIVGNATPNGHTLMLTSSGFAGSVSVYPKLPYDPYKDFSPVTQVISNPLVLVVAPVLGVKSAKDLIALARQKPGHVTYGSTGVGSGTHYGAELLRMAAKFEATHVPYKGVPEALTDTVAGRVNFYLPPVLSMLSLAREGRILPLMITSTQRIALLPDVPTPAEAGIPNYEYDGWYGMLAPGRMPPRILERVSKDMARVLDMADVKERIVAMGGQAKWTTPQTFEKMIRTEIETRAKVFKPGSGG